MSSRPAIVALIAAGLLGPASLRAQTATGTLVVSLAGQAATDGTVRVHVAVTTADAAARVVASDSTRDQRQVWISGIPGGRYRVETRALGFAPDTTFVEIGAGKTANVSVSLERVTALDPVTVAGTSKGHLGPFEKRRASGKGTFLTRDDMSNRRTVTEVLRSVRGLRVDCGSANGCKAHMVRSTTCEPRYFMNGFPSDAAILQTPVLDVAGIEIYRGPSETPGEFMGAQSMCGAIVVWTK